jgi:hypothetical protein
MMVHGMKMNQIFVMQGFNVGWKKVMGISQLIE